MATQTKGRKRGLGLKPAVRVTLGVFDTREPVLRVKRSGSPIADFQPITHADYAPAGGTPLLDAVGRFIGELDQLKAPGDVTIGLLLDESGSMGGQRDAVIESANKFVQGMRDVDAIDPEAAGTVICVVVTDGQENSSRELSREEVQKLIGDREATDQWTFIFLGAKIDAWSEGRGLGLSGGVTGQTVSYSGTSQGTYAAMASVTTDSAALLQNVSAYKGLRTNSGSTMRSITDSGDETLTNLNAADPTSAPGARATSYGDVDEALNKARTRTRKDR